MANEPADALGVVGPCLETGRPRMSREMGEAELLRKTPITEYREIRNGLWYLVCMQKTSQQATCCLGEVGLRECL